MKKQLFFLSTMLSINFIINTREFSKDEIKLLKDNFEKAKQENITQIINNCNSQDGDFEKNEGCKAARFFVNESEENFLKDHEAREKFFEILELAKKDPRIKQFVSNKIDDIKEEALDAFAHLVIRQCWNGDNSDEALKIPKHVAEYAGILFQSTEFVDKEFKQ